MTSSTKKLVAGSAAVAVGAAAVVGGFAAFTDDDVASGTVEAGSVEIAFTDSATAFALEDDIENLGYGDSYERAFTLTNSSTLDIGELEVAAIADGALDGALGIEIDLCPVAWTEDVAEGNPELDANTPTYVCEDGNGDPLASTNAVAYAKNNLNAGVNDDVVDTLASGDLEITEDVFLKVTVKFELPGTPTQGDIDALQDIGDVSTPTAINYTFDATQRTAIDSAR